MTALFTHRSAHNPRWLLVGTLLLSLALSLLVNAGTANAASWVNTGALPDSSYDTPQAVLLPNGRVLAVGNGKAALYDFASNSWSATAPLPNYTGAARAATLADGTVLLAGGSVFTGQTNAYAWLYQTLRYDPATATWTKLADMHQPHLSHTLTVLNDGRVLVTGGQRPGLSPQQPKSTTASAEIFDPATSTWTEVASMNQARYDHQAVLLPDGRVLVAGGTFVEYKNFNNVYTNLASAEIYNPASNSWQTVAPMSAPRQRSTLTVLMSGAVLATGGFDSAANTTERYDPAKNTWIKTGNLTTSVHNHSATRLSNGNVVIVGGFINNGTSSTVAVYDEASGNVTTINSLNTPRAEHAALLINEQLLVVGGFTSNNSAERMDFKPNAAQCFMETGYCVNDPFLLYWQNHGALAINGYPLSNPFPEKLEDGNIYIVQYFERLRMELHPEATPNYRVQLGQFGRRIHPADPAAAQKPGATYFNLTGHNLDGGFRDYWNANGGLDQFGFPITEVISETLGGTSYQVQYFERARFEYHPENAAPYNILLGQFGRQILAGR